MTRSRSWRGPVRVPCGSDRAAFLRCALLAQAGRAAQARERREVNASGFGGRAPTLTLAAAWDCLLGRRRAAARTLLGGLHSNGVAAAGDVPVRFAHRGLHWIAAPAHPGGARGPGGRATTGGGYGCPGHRQPAFAASGALDAWAGLIAFGAGRDRQARLAADGLVALCVRGAPRWRRLLESPGPDNSPQGSCAAVSDGARRSARRCWPCAPTGPPPARRPARTWPCA